MRIVLVGASALAVSTARQLLAKGHEIVIIESSKERIDQLSDDLDCGFIQGDGSRPGTLKDVSPENTDFLFCMSDDDQDNIIAALVGRQLEFPRIVTKIEDEDFEEICVQLGLEDTILPDREVARSLVDIVEGMESAGLAATVKEGVRFFTTALDKSEIGAISDLDLPEGAQVVAVTRNDHSDLAQLDTKLEAGDELLIITQEDQIKALRERFPPRETSSERLTSKDSGDSNGSEDSAE